ncbi:hypothetical protein M0R45_032234 [Rubus argutus]|uniref:GDSL esterase/lipase 1-like n=1 Tax=Rubus argutus TaxID=59490 RepID=A0AAW1WJX3_RUBAR
MATLRFRIYILAFCTSLLIRKSCFHCHSQHQKTHAALFIFGDSLYGAGNDNYINTTTEFQANFWPYGETFLNYSTGRYSNGRLIPDIIAEYANLPLIPPYLQPGFNDYTYGVNFASTAAGALAETHPGFVVLAKLLLKLKGQLNGFKYSNPNVYSKLYDITNNPSKHGFQEGKTACCGSGPYRAIDSCGGKRGVTEYELCDNVADYVFFDYGHPTERVSQKVSKSWCSHTPNVRRPYTNLKELFKV